MCSRELRIDVMGPLAVRVAGRQLVLPRSEVVRGLLGALLLARGEPLPVDRLISVVWDDRAARTRPASVHVGITRLRGWLEDVEVAVEVRREGPGYRLAHAADVDLDHLRQPGPPAGPAADRAYRLARALGGCRGPVLADLDCLNRADPLLLEADRLVRSRCLELADLAEAAGAPELGLEPLRTYSAGAAYDEVVHARLVELLAAADLPAAALLHYEQVRERLDLDLGVRPSDRLYRAGLAVARSPVRQ